MTVCKRVISVMMCVAVIIGTMISANLSAKAESGSELMPGTINDLSYEKIVNSYLSVCEGGYMRVYVDKTVYIEYYDEKLNILSKKSIEPELPMWGGFYAAKEAYYLVEGQRNSDCKNGTEVVRIIKYDKNWKRVGSGSIYSEKGWDYEIRCPFDYGCVNMTEQNGILYVFTSREGYIDEMYGRGHQGMMLISLNEKTMETKIVEANLNHSFTQFIDSDEKWLYLYELSEGSRATILSRLQPETAGSYKKIPVLHYGGYPTSGWAIPTFAYADDVAVSDHSVLGVGYSIDQSMYDEADRSDNNIYNIYLTVTPKDSFTEADTKLIWLTDYKEKFNAFFNLSLAKVNDNRFMVMWEEVERIEKRVKRVSYDPSNPNDPFSGGKLHYLFVDSNGNKVSKEFTASASASQCNQRRNRRTEQEDLSRCR